MPCNNYSSKTGCGYESISCSLGDHLPINNDNTVGTASDL
jgi:hypothetical protein